MKRYLFPLLLFLFLLEYHTVAQISIALHPIKDNTLIETPDTNSNGAGPYIFAGKTGSSNSIRRALLQFDVAGNIPTGSQIDSVELRLYMDQAPNTLFENFNLHQVTRPWGEGASFANGGMGAPAQLNDATWLQAFYGSQLWNNPGGDFGTTVLSSTAVGGVGSYLFPNTTNLINTIQNWLDAPSNNQGFILLGNEVNTSTTKRFGSRENSDSLMRPVLQVWYSPTSSVPLTASKTNPDISIFPNPSSTGELHIHSNKEAIQSIQIYTLAGLAIPKKIEIKANQNKINLDTNDFPSGIYLIFIQTTSHYITKQIVISTL